MYEHINVKYFEDAYCNYIYNYTQINVNRYKLLSLYINYKLRYFSIKNI